MLLSKEEEGGKNKDATVKENKRGCGNWRETEKHCRKGKGERMGRSFCSNKKRQKKTRNETGIAEEKREGRKEMFLMGRDDQRDERGNGGRDRISGLQGRGGKTTSEVCGLLIFRC